VLPDDPLSVRWATLQQPVCRRFGVRPVPSDPDLDCGVARNVHDRTYATRGVYPLIAVRHPVEHGTSGWYVWAGPYSDADDFFLPVHTAHLESYCPELVPFLALPPGWWVELGPGTYENVGKDRALLDS